jgi:hypothetical protein
VSNYKRIIEPDYQHPKGEHFIPAVPAIDPDGRSRVKKHYDLMKGKGFKQVKIWVKPEHIEQVKEYAHNLAIGAPTKPLPTPKVESKPVPEATTHEQLGVIEADALPKVLAYVKQMNDIAKFKTNQANKKKATK